MERQDRVSAEGRVQNQLVKLRALNEDLANAVAHLIRWEKPGASAVVLMGTALQNTHVSWPAEVTAIVNTLQGYQSFLDVEEGRAEAQREAVDAERVPVPTNAVLVPHLARIYTASRADLVGALVGVAEVYWPGGEEDEDADHGADEHMQIVSVLQARGFTPFEGGGGAEVGSGGETAACTD